MNGSEGDKGYRFGEIYNRPRPEVTRRIIDDLCSVKILRFRSLIAYIGYEHKRCLHFMAKVMSS